MDTRSVRESPLALVVVPVGEADATAVVGVLEEMGLRARLHHDAGSALEAVEYDRPAIVVHGWDLPDMDAVTFHGAVRKRAGGRRVPTLAIAPDPEAASRIPYDATGLS
jgi:DNA-binding response OmpR family regulator